ncbi:MAG: DinB family protein [Pseudomonadota bacterium]
MADLPYFRRLARYNRWANRRLYSACSELTRAEWEAPRSGFFPSLQKTLNHILVGDRIWMSRFEGVEHGFRRLDEVPFLAFAELRRVREAEDERILVFLGNLTEDRLAEDLAYRNMAGEAKRTPFLWALAHVFNHQTHHRGQAHAMLSGTRVAPPPIDLLYFLPEDDAA